MTTSEIRQIVIGYERPTAEQLIKRVNVLLAAYWQAEETPETRAGVRALFAKALADYPAWACARALDKWASTMHRRPTPAELVILAERELQPFNAELTRRERRAKEEQEEAERSRRDLVTPEAAARILAEFGMDDARRAAVKRFPQARSIEEAQQQAQEALEAGSHWSDRADPDGPEWRALRAARAKNPLMNGEDTL